MSKKCSLSVVIPVKDEEANIGRLIDDVKHMCLGLGTGYEIIIVDDGSMDMTGQICQTYHPLKFVRFDRNYGQTAALDCGFKLAKGDLIAAIDGDGQNDPKDIPSMIEYMLENDLDAVCGWRKDRKDSFLRRLLMRGAYLCRQVFLHDGIHDSGCTLKVFKRETLHGLTLSDGQHRFIPAILRKKGFKVGEMIVSHRPRVGGRSKYHSSDRIFHGLRDMYALSRDRDNRMPVHYKVKEIVEY